MGMRLSEADIIKLLPSWMRDDEAVKGMAEGINELFQDPGSRLKTLRTWDQINNLTEPELDELAWELNIDWYQDTMTVAQKKAVISSASMVMEKRGTKYAVSEVVNTAFGAGEVQEWFEYEGEPYHFKILVNADEATRFDPDYIRFMLNKVKPVRSTLDEIDYMLTAVFEIAEQFMTGGVEIAFKYIIYPVKFLDGSEILDGSDIMNSGYGYTANLEMETAIPFKEALTWTSSDVYGADFVERMGMAFMIGMTAGSGINEAMETTPEIEATIPEVQPVQAYGLVIENNYTLLDGDVLLDGSDIMSAYRTEEEL